MKTHYLKVLLFSLFALQFSNGQMHKKTAEEFPFTSENWMVEDVDKTATQIQTSFYKGRSALRLEANQKAYLKDVQVENFILEFYCSALSGPGFGFRIKDRQNYEYLYLRLGLSGKKDALQYVPVYNGSLPWQLYNYPKYEGKAVFPREKVATFPSKLKSELAKGKASKKLRDFLLANGFSFSEESEIDIGEDLNYIYDPKAINVLLFEKVDNDIVFLDSRTWIHVKVKVEGDTASFFIEDMKTPAFIVDKLKRDATKGGISLIGDGAQAYFADVSLSELTGVENKTSVNDLPSAYLTEWKVSEMFTKDSVNFVSQIDSLFKNGATFKAIRADEDGLVNISRFHNDMTKTVALTSSLVSETDQKIKLNFDYADHLVILLDSKVLFDKGMNFQPPIGKGEEGRVFVNDEHVELNLRKGKNHLIFLLSADNRQKFNWGFVAKLEHMNGIAVE